MVVTGLANFLSQSEKYRKRKIGLIVNQSSVHDYRYSWDILRERGLTVVRIFSPEHGLFSTEQDQVPVFSQPRLNAEVVSLYRDSYDSLFPGEEFLDGIDTLIYDIQDVGSRYYTYVNTMVYVMKALNGRDMEFIVLDRPNPLGGLAVEGPALEPEFESFVGVLPVPVRHGLTAGELAQYAAKLYGLSINLSVVSMTGWERWMHYPDTGLPWIPPSPNMPDYPTALVYPGSCLFEGLNVSEGRGTTVPFQSLGAPGINPYELLTLVEKTAHDGVAFRPVYFIPTFHKYMNEICGGIFIHVTDRERFRPFRTGVLLAKSMREIWGEMKFLTGVYEFNSIHPTFDLLAGGAGVREMILAGSPLDRIEESWRSDEEGFLRIKEGFHLY